MRGLRSIVLLAISVVCALALTAVSAFADADDELGAKAASGIPLRDINTVSTNQPSGRQDWPGAGTPPIPPHTPRSPADPAPPRTPAPHPLARHFSTAPHAAHR
jgi:hypothetical protein